MSVVTEHVGPWTVDDVLALADDGTHTRHELIDGQLIVSPAPGYPHQRASRRLAALLDQAAVASGAAVEVFEAVNVVTPSGLVIPDIAVAHADAARSAELSLPASAMAAVVEIVSPATRQIDRLVKPGVYAEAGIPTYWRVELHPTPTLTVFTLDQARYAEADTLTSPGVHQVQTPFPATISLADLVTHSARNRRERVASSPE
jgi:Uma2 family endonuclease